MVIELACDYLFACSIPAPPVFRVRSHDLFNDALLIGPITFSVTNGRQVLCLMV